MCGQWWHAQRDDFVPAGIDLHLMYGDEIITPYSVTYTQEVAAHTLLRGQKPVHFSVHAISGYGGV